MNTQEINNLIVVEFSPEQRQFHIHTVEKMQALNFSTIEKPAEQRADYIPLGLFGTSEEASKFANEQRQRLGIESPV